METAPTVWPAMERTTGAAAAAGAELVVYPEVVYPAYCLRSTDRYWSPDIERTTRVIERLSDLARRHRVWIAAGIVEEAGAVSCDAPGGGEPGPWGAERRLYNAAAVVDRRGTLVGIARKNFLWDFDNRWFTPGDAISVFESDFGRMGVLICADGRAPEIAATLAARGATFAVMPTAWVNMTPRSGAYRNPQAEFLIRARAMEFGIPFVCCSKCGSEGATEYVGQSQVVDAEGRVLARAPVAEESLVVAEIEPRMPRRPSLSASARARILEPRLTEAAPRPGPRVELPVGAGADVLIELLQAAGGRAASLPRAGLLSFANARVAALSGAQAIVCDVQQSADGANSGLSESEEILLRARAAENRVFLLAADERLRLAADPSGHVIHREGDSAGSITCDLAKADDKRVTPETDIWAQRRVACYQPLRECG